MHENALSFIAASAAAVARSENRRHFKMEHLNGLPCKACVSVEDMMRMSREAVKRKTIDGTSQTTSEQQQQKNQLSSSSSNVDDASQPSTSHRDRCPVDKDELGRSTWKLLHTMAAYYPDAPSVEEKSVMKTTIESLSKTYPCPHCAEDFRVDIKQHPVELADREKFARWMCEMHNRVNVKLGKNVFDCSKVQERWYDGWKDGSCDF